MQANITTAELAQRLDEPGLTLIDMRPMAAFNGWRLRGEARGGHIPRAIACPLTWLKEPLTGVKSCLLRYWR